MKTRVNVTLEEKNLAEFDNLLREKHISRSAVIDRLLRCIVFAEKYAKENQTYAIVEQFLVELYRLGFVNYHNLLPFLGPERTLEVTNIMRTSRRYKDWVEKRY